MLEQRLDRRTGFADAPAVGRATGAGPRGLVEAYVAGLDPAASRLGVERTVATRTDLIAVSGADRPPRRPARPDGPGDLVVVDYKTGRHMLTVDDARTSLPLALYALAAERVMRRPCPGWSCITCPPGGCSPGSTRAQSLARQLRRAEDIAAECAEADERFRGGPAMGPRAMPTWGGERPGSTRSSRPVRRWCGWCDYRAHCPEGQPRRPSRAGPGTGSAAEPARLRWCGSGWPAQAGVTEAGVAEAGCG